MKNKVGNLNEKTDLKLNILKNFKFNLFLWSLQKTDK